LRKFTRIGAARDPAGNWPVILCAPLAGHHAVMMRETVEALLLHRDVYVTDWTDARDIPPEAGALALDDYVLAIECVIRSIDALGTPVHVVAVCQAWTIAGRPVQTRALARIPLCTIEGDREHSRGTDALRARTVQRTRYAAQSASDRRAMRPLRSVHGSALA
jgi:hypothetical protein